MNPSRTCSGFSPAASPCWAVVTCARATYYKPLWEGFANAQGNGWRTLILWPGNHHCEHPEDLVTPRHPRLQTVAIDSLTLRKPRLSKGKAGQYQPGESRLPAWGVWRELARQNVRGIIVHELTPYTLTALLFARTHGLPAVLMSEVGRGNTGLYPPHVRWWHGFWGRWMDGVIAASPAAREPVCGREMPVFEAFHAVDSRLFQPLPKPTVPKDPVVFVCSGQLIPRKGLDLLFAAAAKLRQRQEGAFRLRLVGGGDEAWARTMAERAGVMDLIEWTGFLSREAMVRAIASADVFVLPTRSDSYAVVVHEAACLGLPLLISQHAGAAEALVSEGVNGHVIDPEDTVAFAAFMERLLEAETRLRYGTAARACGEKLSSPLRGAALWRGLQTCFNSESEPHPSLPTPVYETAS